MNWLNSLDKLLDRGFVRGEESEYDDDSDTNYSQSRGTDDVHESNTWSEDEAESSHDFDHSVVQSNTIDDEDEGDGFFPAQQPLQRSIQHQAKNRPGPGLPVRPGNIRLRPNRNVSISSEEDSCSDEEASISENLDENPFPRTSAVQLFQRTSGATGLEKQPSRLNALKNGRSNSSMDETTSSGVPTQGSDTSSTGKMDLSPLSLGAQSPVSIIPQQNEEAEVPSRELLNASTVKSGRSRARASEEELGSVVSQGQGEDEGRGDQAKSPMETAASPQATNTLTFKDKKEHFDGSVRIEKNKQQVALSDDENSNLALSTQTGQADRSAKPAASNSTEGDVSGQIEQNHRLAQPSASFPFAPAQLNEKWSYFASPKDDQQKNPLQLHTPLPIEPSTQLAHSADGIAILHSTTRKPSADWKHKNQTLESHSKLAASEQPSGPTMLPEFTPIRGNKQPMHASLKGMERVSIQASPLLRENEDETDIASTSSGWSWPQSRSVGGDTDEENRTGQLTCAKQEKSNQPLDIIETNSMKGGESRRLYVSSSDDGASSFIGDITDAEGKMLASELEELRALSGTENAKNYQKEVGKNDIHQQESLASESWDGRFLETQIELIPKLRTDASQYKQGKSQMLEQAGDTNLVHLCQEELQEVISTDDLKPISTDTGRHSFGQSDGTLLVANLEPPGSPQSKARNRFHTDKSEASLYRENICESTPVTAESSGSSDEDDKDLKETRQDPTLFEVEGVSSTWREDPTSLPVEPVNCYGAFHIRVLRAQRLPCPGGSTIQGNIYLLPWKGRARTKRETTFLLDSDNASFDHGVCAQWTNNHDESSTLSLVHAYASEATPIPAIKLELMLSPVKMLEFSMCFLTLPCNALMKRPGKWRRQWFLTEVPDTKMTKDGQVFGQDQIPMVEIEAVFAPEDQSLGTSFVALDKSNYMTENADMDIEQVSIPSPRNELLSENRAGQESTPETYNENEGLVPASNPHLLRFTKFWKPATCGQCSRSLLGWRTKSFRCEACGVDCCEDCRVHLDVQIPCGSSKCVEIVGKAIQNKLTISSFLEAMAPVDQEYEKKREMAISPKDGESSLTDTKTEGGTVSRAGEKGRIGVLKLNFARACVFKSALPAASEPDEVVRHEGELRPGDYYVRVCRTGSDSSARTRTIPSGGKLKFEEASEMRLDVSHYGVHFFIEVVDAISDKPVGTCVLTAQGLLQQQRDMMIEQGQMSILNFASKPPTFRDKRRMTLELRAGVKSGISGDFFVPAESKADQGVISGWVELSVGLEEDVKRLFGSSPYECPAPPPDSLNLNTLNLHISRLSDFVEDTLSLLAMYQYVVSWRSPLLTGFTLVFFLTFTVRFDSEYVGCIPFLFVVMCMLASACSRSNAKNRFVEEEADEWKAAEEGIHVPYSLHRPVGRINISVSKGKHIRSRDLGLAGNVGCRVYLDPLRFANEKQSEKIVSIDKSANTIHEIGSTESKFTTNPVWNQVIESEECKRLKQVLPHHGNFFETEEELSKEVGCEFPVLQPFRRVDDQDDNPRHFNATLEPWKTSTAGVVFQVRFGDILNMLPGSDHIFGEIALPLALVIEQREISGWFQVLEVGTTDVVQMEEEPTNVRVPANASVGELAGPQSHDVPKVFLAVRWSPPEKSLDSEEASETEREASIVIQEELLRWEGTNRDKVKLKQLFVGGSIGAFKTLSGFAGTLQVIQNLLGRVANTLEASRNLLNFTDPYKSSLVLALVSILWVILSLVPTRLIVLVAGLAQFGITAKTRLRMILADSGGKYDDDDSVASDLDRDEEGGVAPIIWLKNALRGLPTDEDLRKAYFWEGRRIGVMIREKYATEKRKARLKRLWRAQWHAIIKIRTDGPRKRNASKVNTTWVEVFAVVQGRRFLWWKSVSDFDQGSPPEGRIFLAGHAGLSGLSPLEIREIKPTDVPLVVGVFGRGLQAQQRVTLLLPTSYTKESLEKAIIEAAFKED